MQKLHILYFQKGEKMKKLALSLGLLATLGFAKEDILMFHAGSLSVPFAEIEKVFEAKYPQYDVKREASGSVAAARKTTDLKRAADVMASADYKVIDNMLIPNHAKFNAHFATNEMVLAYTEKSKYAKEITSDNWPDIFLKEGVTVGHSNPNLDPCGYRSMLVTMLAEKHYNKPGLYDKLFGYGDHYEVGEEDTKKVIVRPKETDLLGLLEAHQYDYLYIYKSVADQHKLHYVTLPKEVSLQSAELAELYKSAKFNIDGKKPGEVKAQVGAPMVYGITVLQNENSPVNKEGAVKLVNFILSPEGAAILKKNGQDAIQPPAVFGDASILGK
jgi:molybdate/tungstate transport system substrate-binding protein